MAYSYDGYLRFNTEVDQSGFNNGVNSMKSAAALGAKSIAVGITAATGAITALSVASIRIGSDFEASMSKVAAISGATGDEKFETPMRNAAKAATDSLNDILQSLNSGQLDKSVDQIADSTGNLLEKTAELAADGIPKLLNGFSFIIDHGKEVEATLFGISAIYGVMKFDTLIGGWKAATTALEAYKVATMASQNVSVLLVSTMTGGQLAVGGLTGAISVNTIATVLATKAQVAFNAVFGSSVFGAAAIAIGAVTAGLIYYNKVQKEANAATEEMINNANDAVRRIARERYFRGAIK